MVDENLPDGPVQERADASAKLLAASPVSLWVRLWALAASQYAENRPASEADWPVLANVLLRRLPGQVRAAFGGHLLT